MKKLFASGFLVKQNYAENDKITICAVTDDFIYQGFYYQQVTMSASAVNLKRFAASAPFLKDHDSVTIDSVLGRVSNPRFVMLDGLNCLFVDVVFSSDEEAQKVKRKIMEGVLTDFSIGFAVHDFKIQRDFKKLEGAEYSKPLVIITEWEPYELSAVAIPADSNAKIMQSIFNENGINFNLTADAAKGNIMPKGIETTQTPAVEPVVQPDVAQAAIKAERERVSGINEYVTKAGYSVDVANTYIANGTSLADVKMNVDLLKKQEASQPQITNVEMGTDERDKKREGLEDALLNRIDRQNFGVTEKSKIFIGKSFIRQLESYMGRNPMEGDLEFARRAMSSSDLPLILANIASKSAQKRYSLQPRSSQAWRSNGSLKDYKRALQVRAGDFGNLLEMNESGEYQEASIGEEGEYAQLKKYGRIHKFSDIMIVNDDLSQIMKVASEAGVAASRLENQLVYGVLTANANMNDGDALFSTDHANLDTNKPLTAIDGISKAFQLMRSQTSVDGSDKLNIAPKFLIVPPSLETDAKKIMTSISPAQASNVNPFSNSLQIIVDAEIEGDYYYFAADPNEIETVCLFNLEGQNGPKVESRVNWANDAIEVKASHSVVAMSPDYRGLVRIKKDS